MNTTRKQPLRLKSSTVPPPAKTKRGHVRYANQDGQSEQATAGSIARSDMCDIANVTTAGILGAKSVDNLA